MEPWAEMDVVEVLQAKGFKNEEVQPFTEAQRADLVDNAVWRFPWTVIVAEK